MRLGKTLFLPSDFKTKSCEKFILWKIAARKLDFAASKQQRQDQTAVMSKPAYLSLEIVTDNPTSVKISIPQLFSVDVQTGLSLTWSQSQHACVSTVHAN